MLAHVTLIQEGNTLPGQLRALDFADEARRITDYCLQSGSREPAHAQAAIILGVYEMHPHSHHSAARLNAALVYMDSCLRACVSQRLDVDNPHISASLVGSLRQQLPSPSRTEGAAPHVKRWVNFPAWSEEWTPAEVQREEMRRMFWSASAVTASAGLWRCTIGRAPLVLSSTLPVNFSVLYPGEAYYQQKGEWERGKLTPWALYHRTISLWHMTVNSGNVDRARRSEIVQELQAIEEALSMFSDMADYYIWQAKDWIIVTRMFLNAVNWSRLDSWFQRRLVTLAQFADPPDGIPKVTQRPLYCWWYLMQGFVAIQLSRMSRSYWKDADDILEYVYDALKAITEVWPCSAVEQAWTTLRKKHDECLKLRNEGGAESSLIGPFYPLV
ncbi:hypothetical protein M231_05677 [Tremella mesenterica]|uniref:Transcription factor domain-containing protein n=1 Tax=Tremella mesenterica TaxID=5217 RepID=A0A4Q1BHK3_TREME|nr:hypothetical protein M231_05677 [Tremella mesenterica]